MAIFDATTVRVGPGPIASFFRILVIVALVCLAGWGGIWLASNRYTWWYELDSVDAPAQMVDVSMTEDLSVDERITFDTGHGAETLTVVSISGLTATITDLDGDTFTCAISSLLNGSPDCTNANVPTSQHVRITNPVMPDMDLCLDGQGGATCKNSGKARATTHYVEATHSAVKFTCAQPLLRLGSDGLISQWSCDNGATWNIK